MMLMCNTIHLMLARECVYQCHEVLMMSKLSIKRATNSAQMMEILNKMMSAITVLWLNSKMITENSV